jgi:5-(carboxyamino)imidazole ribonucleotide mutase
VAINNAKNAGLLAVQILGIADESLSIAMQNYKDKMQTEVLEKAQKVEKGRGKIGFIS